MSSSTEPIEFWKYIADTVNKSQYFNPLFSWVVVAYTYYTVGRRGGAIWKYLFIVVTFGFLANVINIIKTYAYESNFYLEYAKYINWLDTYFYGLNEWGFVYINFRKIKACVNILKHKFWNFFIFFFLGYTLFCRTMIAYYKVDEEYIKYYEKFYNSKPIDITVTQNSTRFHAALYIPIGIIELIFILCVMIQYFREKSGELRNELSTLLHSTLFRMLIISAIYIFIAIDVLFENEGYILFSRRFLWRVKGIFGIVFLVDILLIRIDIDNNTINNQKDEIENKEKEIALSSINKNNELEIVINTNSMNNNSSNKNTTNSSTISRSHSPLIVHNPANNIFNYNGYNVVSPVSSVTSSVYQNQEPLNLNKDRNKDPYIYTTSINNSIAVDMNSEMKNNNTYNRQF